MSDVAVGDATAPVRTDRGTAPPPAERGRLTVAARAVETVAARETRRATQSLGTDHDDRPSVSARVAGSRASLAVDAALPWGPPVADSAAQVQTRVRERTAMLTGLSIDDMVLSVSGLASATSRNALTTASATAPDATLRPAPAPRAAGPAVAWGLVVSVAVIALGAVAAHDALSLGGALAEQPWVPAALDAVDGTTAQWWVLAGGVASVVLGLVLVVASLRPRPRRALAFAEQPTVSLLIRDLPRAASGLARGVDGVLGARADATRRRVRVWIETTGDASVVAAVQQRLDSQFSVLARPPRVVVIDERALARSAS